MSVLAAQAKDLMLSPQHPHFHTLGVAVHLDPEPWVVGWGAQTGGSPGPGPGSVRDLNPSSRWRVIERDS